MELWNYNVGIRSKMIPQILSNLLARHKVVGFRQQAEKSQIFDNIVGYGRIKRTILRSLNSREPVHILLVGPPGQAKTLFLNYITFWGKLISNPGGLFALPITVTWCIFCDKLNLPI
jgi:hypothetical protein